MGKFRHHSYFAKPKQAQAFRFPFVCFACRKSFKYPVTLSERHCPQCRSPMVMLSRKFSAPKSKDRQQWEKVRLLVAHGFRFYAVYRRLEWGGELAVRYPQTLQDAEQFIAEFAEQAKP